jgi:hypothetical protein
MKRISLLIVLLAFALLLAPQASATVYTLTGENTALQIDPSSQAGAFGWVTDGFSVLYQQWFWYRIGNTAEASIDKLPLLGANLTASALNGPLNSLQLNYGSASGLEIEVGYQLHGGSLNSFTSDVAETITIFNHGRASLNVHFFQYSDFDLAANVVDTVRIDPSKTLVDQAPASGNGPMLSETVLTPRPSHAEANYYANTLGELNDGSPTTLNDVLTAGPGDVTWAFEWDKTIASGGSLIISKDKNLAPVPEPAPLAFLGGILVFLARKFRTYIA